MIKTIYFVFFICAFALGLWACTGKEQEKFKSLSTAHFEQLIKDNKIQLVDVRTVAEYSEGHIPGSLNINVMDENFAAAVDELLQKDQPVAVYCKSGRRNPAVTEQKAETSQSEKRRRTQGEDTPPY